MGCVLPEAFSPARFWENVAEGRSALRPLTGGHWEWERLGLADLPGAGRIEGFTPDWRAFRIPPADAAAMNPAQLQVLEAGRQALSGVRSLPRERTGIWLGATGLGWQPDTALRVRLDELADAVRAGAPGSALGKDALEEALASARARLESRLHPASEEPVVNSAASIAAGRLAMAFDLRGPHCAVDAGFASGLAALDLAARALRDATVDCAVFGGASELLSPAELAAMSRMGVLARRHVRPFDAEAEGTLPGEGVVLFAAKRLEDALRDGDHVHALILGIGAACDGGAGSLLAPRADALALAIRRAHDEADVQPGSIRFIECHATGTPVGDAVEVRALREVHGACPGAVALGSSKPLVGHLRGASGAVGLLRTVLALEHAVIPAQARFSRSHPDLQLEGTSLFVPLAPQPLRPVAGASAARAGVTALSLGGIAYHAIVEAHTPGRPPAGGRAHRRSAEPIAVIGLGGVFPGADDVPAFWQALLDGRDAIREIPRERWDPERYCDADPGRLDRSYTRIGAFVDEARNDPRWRIPPAIREAVDPGHLLALRAAEEAIAHAGLERGPWDRERTGVFLGFMACQGRKLLAEVRFHFARFAAELAEELAARGVDKAARQRLLSAAASRIEAGLPPLSEDSLPGWMGSIAAARIARRFDLRGPQLAIESACASTLAALMSAVEALRDGSCDTALVGGLWADMQPEFYVGSCRFNALSATGSTPFDARADGFVPGEGAGLLVLRRLSSAERDGQRIHAVVRAVAASSDGKGKSVFAPSVEGESLAMARALEEAGADPALVDYVECHGTGTALGDRTEIEACLRAYGRGRVRPLRVGSVKSNFGHLLAAAAAPALLKTVLAVREGQLPPSLHVEQLNPAIEFGEGPIEVVARSQPWSGPEGNPRRAGVSSFGLGGTNLHAIVEEYRAPRLQVRPRTVKRADPGPEAILPIAAAGGADAAECVERLGALAVELRGQGVESYLGGLRAGQQQAAGAPYRVAIVAPDPAALEARVALLARGLSGVFDIAVLRKQGIYAAEGDAPAAAMFPGQGPQYPNMLRDALRAFPSLGETLDAADRAYVALCGRPLRPAFFTDDPAGYTQEDEDIHCAVFAVNVALYRLLARYGFAPRALMGQSAGELAALVAARSMSLEDGLAVVRERTLSVLAISTEDPGRMIALACGAERAEQLVAGAPGYAAMAADNGPEACIVSGDRRATPEILRRAASEGIEASVLAVSHGYHSRLIAAARPRYLGLLRRIPFRAPEIEVISTVTGESLANLPPEQFPDHLASQFVEPVRLRPAVEALHARGVRLFVECGPKWPLTTFVSQILSDRPHVAQATIHPKVGETEQLHRTLACLFAHGAAVLHPQEDPQMKAPPPLTPEVRFASQDTAQAPPAAQWVALLRGVRDLIDGYLLEVERRGASPAAPPPPSSSPHALQPPWAAAAVSPSPLPPSPLPSPPGSGGERGSRASSSEAASSSDRLETLREEVRRVVVDELVRRTGYPEDMLDPDLDLEAELGIDTVKQVAVLAAARERFGLPPDPAFKLRDANTIRKAVEVLARRLAGGPTDPRDPSGGPRPPPRGGLPLAAPTRDAIPGRDPFRAARPETSRRLVGALLSAVHGERIRGLEGLSLRLSGEDSPPREPFVDVAPLPESPGTFKLRAVQGHDLADAVVRTAPPPALAVAASPEILQAIAPDRRERAASGAELRESLAPVLGDADGLVEWARSDGFMVAVGGAHLPAGDDGHRLAAVLACASEVASFAWLGLTGAPHAVCAIESATFDALPDAGTEIGIHAKMVAPEGGLWRADVTIVCGSARVAEMRGVSGSPLARAPAAEGPLGEAAVRAWQRFCRRIQGEQVTEGVA